MLEPNRIQMNVYPQTIQKLGNGTYYYNYDIKEVEAEVTDQEGDTKLELQYNFIQVLLNSYNSYTENPTGDSEALLEYKEYLSKLKEIKAKVKEDFAKL